MTSLMMYGVKPMPINAKYMIIQIMPLYQLKTRKNCK